jgi:hypothetical protein
MRKNILQTIRCILAALLITEGLFYTLGVLSILFFKHLLLLEPRILLTQLGYSLLKGRRSAGWLTLGYSVLALALTIIFHLDFVLITPLSTNILFTLGLVIKKGYSAGELEMLFIIFTCYRFLQLALSTTMMLLTRIHIQRQYNVE